MRDFFWYRRSGLSFVLIPLAWLFRLISWLRHRYYKRNPQRIWQCSVPVCIVGNITVGGTGKTPLLIWLANWLAKEGVKVGVVSRGYGGRSKHYPLIVTSGMSSAICGEEPLLIVSKTQAPVVVDPDRVRAVKKLTDVHHVDVILADDGLQHYPLGRTLEIAVLDGTRGVGNGRFLPAGPLREPVSRLGTVDWVIANTKASGVWDDEWIMQFIPVSFVHLGEQRRIPIGEARELFPKNTVAVSAIGNPARFHALLKDLELETRTVAFPDHHRYSETDFDKFQDSVFIVTEKDAPKILELPTMASRCWCLEIDVKFPPEVDEFLHQLFTSKGIELEEAA